MTAGKGPRCTFWHSSQNQHKRKVNVDCSQKKYIKKALIIKKNKKSQKFQLTIVAHGIE